MSDQFSSRALGKAVTVTTIRSASGVQSLHIWCHEGRPYGLLIVGRGFAVPHCLSKAFDAGSQRALNTFTEDVSELSEPLTDTNYPIISPSIARFDDVLAMALRTTVLA